jgi:hypothetical protein
LTDTDVKRAEAILVADPFFDYNLYDNDGPDGVPNSGDDDGLITTDELLILAVFADNAPTGATCDQHIGHPNPPNCAPRPGGNTRRTNPAQVPVDQHVSSPVSVYQYIAGVGEMAHVGVVVHEIGHSHFGLGDLYPHACHIYYQVEDGYICKFCINCNDDCGNAICFGDGFRATNITNMAQGTDVTNCGNNDTNDVWFEYTPTTSEQVTISLRWSEFDTTLAVFNSCGGTEISCNDNFDFNGDGTDELQSQIILYVISGVTYWIRVAGSNGAIGKYRLTITGGEGGCSYTNDPSLWFPPAPGHYSLMDGYWVDYVTHLDPWAKIHLGFVKPLVVTHDGIYTLHDAETDRNFSTQGTQPEAIVIYDPLRADPYREYFILENRNEALIDDQGLAIWLIDETTNDWRKAIRLIRRGGHWVDMIDAMWNGVDDANGYDFTATSTPRNTNWTDGTKSYVEIYDISQAGPAMTFKVRMPPIFVDWDNDPLVEIGSQDFPFDEVDEAIAAIPEAPRTIRIAGGSYPKQLVINTACTLKGWRNGNAVIGQ